MLDINLLPPEYGPGKIVSPTNLIVIGLSFLICLSLLLSSLKLMTRVQDQSLRLEYHEAQIELYKREAEKIRELATRVQLLSARLNLVEELLQEKTSWSDKFVKLSQCLPQYGAWVNTLTVERSQVTRQPSVPGGPAPSAEPIIADLSGDVATIDRVRQFVGNLEDSDTFGNIIFDKVVYDRAKAGTEAPATFGFSVEIVESKRNF